MWNNKTVSVIFPAYNEAPNIARAVTDFKDVVTSDGTPIVDEIKFNQKIPASAQNDTIAQATQRVRPGGRLIVKDIVTRPRWRAAANQLHDLIMTRQWVRHMNEEEIRSAIDTRNIAGSWSNILQVNTLWYGHHLMVFERTLEG